ncbi:hypothetical protein BGZ65_000926 [Modicella reniformis]|uniref:Uncharacterized protein n=1 Tax=Modicella reniformis TaxID=1440133 RepID=A0A9P6MJ22_9FUNG|nr:hypothetical protein BGZ65_000926 [Modicella reniformis]
MSTHTLDRTTTTNNNTANNPRTGSRTQPTASTLLALDVLLARAASAVSSPLKRPLLSASRRMLQPLPPTRLDTLANPLQMRGTVSPTGRLHHVDSADTEDDEHGNESADEAEDIDDIAELTSAKEQQQQQQLTAYLLQSQIQQRQQDLLHRRRLQRQHQREQYQRLYKEQQLQLQQQRLEAERESEGHQENKEHRGHENGIEDRVHVHSRVTMTNPFKVSTGEQNTSQLPTSRSRKPNKLKSNSNSDITTTAIAIPVTTTSSSTAKETTKSTLETAVPSILPASGPSAPSAPPKRQYKKTILRQQAALLAAQIKDENEARDLEATWRVLARADNIKRLRLLQSRLAYASYKVKRGLEDQPLELVAELFEESLEEESANSGDDSNRLSFCGTSLGSLSDLPSEPESHIQTSADASRRANTAVRVGCTSPITLTTYDATHERRRQSISRDRSHGSDEGVDQNSLPRKKTASKSYHDHQLQILSDDSGSDSTTNEHSSWSAQDLLQDIDLTNIALIQQELELEQEQERQIEELQQEQREQLQQLWKIQQDQKLALQKAHERLAARCRLSVNTPTNSFQDKPRGPSQANKATPDGDKESQYSHPSTNSIGSSATSSRQPQRRLTSPSPSPSPSLPAHEVQHNNRTVSEPDLDRIPLPSTDHTSCDPMSGSTVGEFDVTSNLSPSQLSENMLIVRAVKDEDYRSPSRSQRLKYKQEEYLQLQQQKLQQNRQREQELLRRQRQLELQQLQQHKRKQWLLQLHKQQGLEQEWEKQEPRESFQSKHQLPLAASSPSTSQVTNRLSKPVTAVGSAAATLKKKKPLKPVQKAPNTENILASVRDSASTIRSALVAATPALSTAKNLLLGTKRMHSAFEDKENIPDSPHSSPLLRNRLTVSKKDTNPFYDPPQPRPKVHKRQKPASPTYRSPTLPLSQPTTVRLTAQLEDSASLVVATGTTPIPSPTAPIQIMSTPAEFTASLSTDNLSSESTEVNGDFLHCFDQWMSELGSSEDVAGISVDHGFQPPFEFAAIADLVSAQDEDPAVLGQSNTEDEIGPGGQSGQEDETELDESELDRLLYSDAGDEYYGSYGAQGYVSTPTSEINNTQEIVTNDPVVADLYDWFPETIQHDASFDAATATDPHLSILSVDPTLSSFPAELAQSSLELTLDFATAGDPLWLQQELRMQQERQREQQQQQDEQQQQQQQQQQQRHHHQQDQYQQHQQHQQQQQQQQQQQEQQEQQQQQQQRRRQQKGHKQQSFLSTQLDPHSQLHETSTTDGTGTSRSEPPPLDLTRTTLLSSTFSDILSPSTLLAQPNSFIPLDSKEYSISL